MPKDIQFYQQHTTKYITQCPHREDIMVGSLECTQCPHCLVLSKGVGMYVRCTHVQVETK